MLGDIILFQSAIIISLLIFVVPLRYKYFATLVPILLVMGITTVWAIDVLANNVIKEMMLSFNVSEQVFSFWSNAPMIRIDQLSALFIIMINIVTLGCFIYAYGYLKSYLGKKSSLGMAMHYFSYFLMYTSLLLLTMLNDGFMFLFIWELMTLSSFVLITFDGEKSHIMKIGISYLVQMHVGFLFLLAAFLIANKETGIWGFDALPIYFKNNNNLALFLLFFVGFGVKAGLIPFHSWLPHAHPVAPSHVSSIMSGILVKMGIFGILKVTMSLQANFSEIASIMIVVSLVTLLFSISMSVFQNDLKKLLAYSTIENVGVICLGISLSIYGKANGIPALTTLGMLGAIFHIVSHSLYKSMLFLLAGTVKKLTGTVNINHLGGISKKMPITSAFFLIGSLSLCALPPFNGFVSEFLMYKGAYRAIASGDFFISVISIIVVIVLALSGGICIYTMTKAFGLSFLGSQRKPYKHALEEPKWTMQFPMVLNTILMLGIGLVPILVFPIIYQTLHVFGYIPEGDEFYPNQFAIFQKFGLLSVILVSLFAIIYLVRKLQQKRVKIDYGPTWGCGYAAGDARHQYTSNTYADSLKGIISPMVKQTNTYHSYREEEIFPPPRKYETETKDNIETNLILKPINFLVKLVPKLGLAQTGRIQHYLIYPLAFLILIAVLTGFNII